MPQAEQLHAHPLTILANLWRVFYLVIIPVIRGFLVALQGDLAHWAQGAWIDILVFLAMIAIAVWRWWVIRYTFDDREIAWTMGWLVRKKNRVAWEKITTVSVVESFYLRPFQAARVRADTIGGSAGRADFTVLLWKKQAMRLLTRARARGGVREPREYTPQTGSILALSLLTSNSLGGILFISTFVSQSGRLLGNEFSDLLVGTFERAARILAFGLPPAAAALAYLLLGGWLVGFLLTFFRYKNFTVSRGKTALNVSGGLLSAREYCINYHDINYIDIRQSMITKVLKLYSLYISAVGYGKLKDDINCIIPTENRKVFTLNRERLFPAFAPCERQVAPKMTGIFRFIGAPLALCAALSLAMALLLLLFPGWRGFILFVGLMSMVPTVFLLVIRAMEFATSGIAKSGKYYTVRYSKGFYLHTVIIPETSIVGIELRQSPVQRLTPNCDVIITTRSETQAAHRCRNLNREAAAKLLRINPRANLV